MTLPGADGPAHSLGHRSPEAEGEQGRMQMGELSLVAATAWIVGTYVILLLVLWLTSLWVPISFGG